MKVPMTKRGADLLRDELHRLKTVERPANSTAIGEARAHGDLSENAEYHAARERAGFIEGRIYVSSPIARALIGKEPGEVVEVQTPGGVKRYEIIDVRYE